MIIILTRDPAQQASEPAMPQLLLNVSVLVLDLSRSPWISMPRGMRRQAGPPERYHETHSGGRGVTGRAGRWFKTGPTSVDRR